jgi:hypothetical protein
LRFFQPRSGARDQASVSQAPASLPGRVGYRQCQLSDADLTLKDPSRRPCCNGWLLRMGFDVDVGEPIEDAMRRAFDRLNGKIRPGSIVLVSLAGAIQANRQNYMSDDARLDRG